MSDLIAIAYPDVDTAKQVTANAARAQQAHEIELDDMVIVERRGDGKVKLHQPSMAGAGAVSGDFQMGAATLSNDGSWVGFFRPWRCPASSPAAGHSMVSTASAMDSLALSL